MNPSRILYVLVLAVVFVFSPINPASAQPATEPLEKFVVTDGLIYAMTKNSNVFYFGGAFGQVGARTGSGVPVSADTGAPEANYPFVNGEVSAAINDGAGGWFVGGTFTEVGGFLRTNLVHIKSDRTVDANWNPSANGGAVYTMVLTNGTVYFGGNFTNVNGQTRNHAASVNALSGVLNSWDPNVNTNVKALVAYGTNIYIGGEFTAVTNQARGHLAAVDATTGFLTSWNPGTSDFVEAMVLNNGHLFVGGYFTSVSSQGRGCGASFDLSTGNLDPWNPSIVGLSFIQPVIWAMDAWQNTIYFAGVFSGVGGANRTNVAALDATTAIATSWDAKQYVTGSSGFPVQTVYAVTVYSNALYVGGTLTYIGGQPRGYAAALDLVTGNATAWDPKVNQTARAFSGVGNALYLGGTFGALGCVSRTNLAAYDIAANQVTSWNPGVLSSSSPPVYSLLVTSNQVFVGGNYTNIAGVSRLDLAALDPVSGSALDWNPNSASGTMYSLATWNDRLYVGGGFTSMGGAPLTNFAEFDLNTGLVTSWDPAIRSLVQVMTVSGDTLYVGGNFSSVSGQIQRRVAAFDLNSDTLTAWNPVVSGSYVEGIAVSGNNVYLGGLFSTVGGLGRTNFAAVDASTAQVLPPVANADSFVYTVACTSNLVFIGGNFGNLSGQSRNYIAALDANTGNLLDWNPGADLFVKNLSVLDNTLYVGGAFRHLGVAATCGLGAYPLSLTGTPAIVPNSIQRATNGDVRFRLSAFSVPQATVQVSTDLVNWQSLGSVPLASGYGVFTETNTPTGGRFYRISVP